MILLSLNLAYPQEDTVNHPIKIFDTHLARRKTESYLNALQMKLKFKMYFIPRELEEYSKKKQFFVFGLLFAYFIVANR